MNCEPNDAPIVELKKNWTMLSVADNTYPSSPSKPATKCIDFIFVLKNKAQYEFVKSEVPTKFENGSVTEASDHLPIYVDVKLK
jgi:endonuclease/exonuclease/phosphatase family metal-dependent hydrolase